MAIITNGALLRKNQVAERLGLSLASVDRMLARGELEVVRFGRAVRIRPAAIDQLIERGVSKPEAR